IIPVETGELASGLYGEGRMAEPETIVQFTENIFFLNKDLEGKKILVTAGPTYESLDPVRFIGNRSSGKMGIAIAEELADRGAKVDLVLGPSSLKISSANIIVHHVESASQMYDECVKLFANVNAAIMSAAVADYTPAIISKEKIKKAGDTLTLELKKTKDILKTLGQQKKKGQVVVGFALENNNEKEYAIGKLEAKNADMIVLNSLNDEGAGFSFDTNKITILEKSGVEFNYERKPKQQVAKDIVDRLVNLLYAK
ncbi:MAG TPA: bifunctional phosphopantothenoylcysteine decarboxylase/phosphopantothenate--cysteine ligase CoaBC, partial [Puia sp.]|nr:bifunctional phosphopantothenoylcysteine decarboxylase/phosphopantothenate--cysteine ligase CoaBC [Puia sp.]